MVRPPASTFVVLGLLAKRSGSGYDTAAFAERSVCHFWPISRTQIYSELPRLEKLGWAAGTTVAQERYPNKRVYEPTTAGLKALRDWLDAPQESRQRVQEAVVLKVFLGAYMSPDRLADALHGHRQRAEARHDQLAEVVEHIATLGLTDSRRFGQAAARYGMLQAQATIAWTEEVQSMLRDGAGPPHD